MICKIKNKRGSVPVVIFVLAVSAICGIAIFLFLTSDARKEKEFKIMLDIIQESASVEENVNFFINAGRDVNIEGLEVQADEYIFHEVKYKPKGFFAKIFGGKDEILAEVFYKFNK